MQRDWRGTKKCFEDFELFIVERQWGIFNPSLKIERSSFQNKLHRRFGFHKGGGRGIHLIEWNKKRKSSINQKFHLPFLPLRVFRRNKKDRGATRRIKERKINETLQITKNGNSSIMEWNEKLLYL